MVFESQDHKDLAPEFQEGVARDIPFGIYKIEARLPGYFSEARYVRVYQHRVTIVVGLNMGSPLPIIPPRLRGRVVGLSLANHQGAFAKLIGVFSKTSLESQINSSGEFEMAGVTDGLYLLLVASEKGVLASRAIKIPYTGSLEIKIGAFENQE
jgi:hypothetical protein